MTQFGRMCAALGIRIIAASSPQAKGRVERGHGTHQDRLIKKLRRKGIRDYTAANTFLASEYLAGHDARFAQPPAAPEDFHTPFWLALIDQVFCLEIYGRWATTGWCGTKPACCNSSAAAESSPPRAARCSSVSTKRGAWTSGSRGARPVDGHHRDGRAGRASAGGRRDARPRERRMEPDGRRRDTHPWRQRYHGLRDAVSPGESIPGRPGAWFVPPAASAGPPTQVGDPLGGLVAQPE